VSVSPSSAVRPGPPTPTVAVAEPTDGESGVALHQQTPVYRGKTLAMNILIRENTTCARRVLTREAAVD
jgi:hypothetical protein